MRKTFHSAPHHYTFYPPGIEDHNVTSIDYVPLRPRTTHEQQMEAFLYTCAILFFYAIIILFFMLKQIFRQEREDPWLDYTIERSTRNRHRSNSLSTHLRRKYERQMQMEIRNQFCDHLIRIGQFTETLANGNETQPQHSNRNPSVTRQNQLQSIPETLVSSTSDQSNSSINLPLDSTKAKPIMKETTVVLRNLHRTPFSCCFLNESQQDKNEFYDVKFSCPNIAVLEDEITMI